MNQAPILNGRTLRRPNAHRRGRVSVGRQAVTTGGRLATYHRGYRTVIELSWDNLRPEDAASVEAAATATGGAVQYVDLDGVAYVVLVEFDGLDAVPGTDPVRYRTGLTLTQQTPR